MPAGILLGFCRADLWKERPVICLPMVVWLCGGVSGRGHRRGYSPLCPHLPGDPGPELLAVEQSVRKAEPKDLKTVIITAGKGGGEEVGFQ